MNQFFGNFDTNVPNIVENRVKVRGVLVPFGLLDIHVYYGLMDMGQGKYENYLSGVEYNDAIEPLL